MILYVSISAYAECLAWALFFKLTTLSRMIKMRMSMVTVANKAKHLVKLTERELVRRKVRSRMALLGLTGEQAAKQLGISHGVLRNVISGHSKCPNLRPKIEKLLGETIWTSDALQRKEAA
jgi:hypothetical protein